jgi:peroxiredoxin
MTTPKSLQSQLDEQRSIMLTQVPPSIKETLLHNIEKMQTSDFIDNILGVGDRAPDFTLPDTDGRMVNLYKTLATSTVVISYYRGDWCPYCNLELRALEQIKPDVERLGAKLIAISPQTLDNSIATVQKLDLTFEVLSDEANQVARRYGLVFTVDEAIRPIYRDFGIHLDEANGDLTFELPIPATYIIEKTGVITSAFADVDYTKRMEPCNILDGLSKFL